MTAPGYDSYRESGVRHIGDLPTHWSLVALKRVATFTYGDALAADVRGEGDIKVFGSNGPVGTHSAPNTSAPVVFVGRKGSCGALTWSDAAGFAIDTVYYVDPSCCRADLRWLYWTLHTLGLEHSSQDTGVPGLSREVAHSSPVPLSPPAEQAAIAAFLDRETGKIDALVEAQTRLIELLKEKRQAVISHAVTKGLDPAAPMKNSGIEWLGQVPAHWEVKKLGSICSKIGSGKTPSGGAEAYAETGIAFLRSQNVYDEGLWLDELVYIPEAVDKEMSNTRVQPGDVLLNITGASLGRTCIVPEPFERANVNQHVCIIRLQDVAQRDFVSMAMKSISTKGQIDATQNGAAREGLNFQQIAELRVALPPENEASEIVKAVCAQIGGLDRLTEQAEAAISLLQERRAALISAAVTGKIDVRGLASEQAEAA